MKLSKTLLICFILAFFVFNSVNITTAAMIYTPVSESLNLKLDGSITPVTINLTETFHYVTYIMLHMEYDDPNFIGGEFGEGTALINGTRVLYKGNSLVNGNLKDNDDFYDYFADVNRFTDDKDPKSTHIHAHLDFTGTFQHNLRIHSFTDFQIVIQDDLTSATYDLTSFDLFIHGFLSETAIENTQRPPNLLAQIQGFAVGFMSEPLFWVILLIPLAFIITLVRK